MATTRSRGGRSSRRSHNAFILRSSGPGRTSLGRGGGGLRLAAGAQIVETRLDDELLENAWGGGPTAVANRFALRGFHQIDVAEILGRLQLPHEHGDGLIVQGHPGDRGLTA